MENAGGAVKAGLPDSAATPYPAAMARTDEERERRLAAALRDNLKRRKAQGRALAADDAAPAAPPPVTPLPEQT